MDIIHTLSKCLILSQVLDKDSQPQDILSWLLIAQWSGDKSAPPETAFPEDSRLLIVAGRSVMTEYFLLSSHP